MSSNFGELVLVLGDLHIPERASKIAAPIQRMLVPNKMQHVICTGNVSPESLRELQQLAPNLHCVSGDYDFEHSYQFPETQIVQVGAFRIGVLHGHQLIPWKSREAVQRMRRKLRVDILITGHTHQSEVVVEDDGFCHINPGSITGAYSTLSDDAVTPSFILLAVQDTKVVCYVYELINGAVDVSKTEFTKSTTATMASNPALLDGLLK